MRGATGRHRSALRLAVGTIGATWALSSCGTEGGALDASVWPGDVVVGTDAAVGESVGVGGGMVLVNDSDEAVVIDDVELVDSGDDLVLDGWVLRDVVGRAGTGTQRPFPPTDARPDSQRLVEPTDSSNGDGPPAGDVEIVVGVRATEPGEHRAQGVRVRYRDGAVSREILFPLTVVICVDRVDRAGACAPAD